MGFLFFKSKFELLHWQLWNEWVDQEKDVLNAEKKPSKKEVWPNTLKHNKDDPNQNSFEEGLALFIVKELVPLSFVETPFF
jgi:hypothetical protein